MQPTSDDNYCERKIVVKIDYSADNGKNFFFLKRHSVLNLEDTVLKLKKFRCADGAEGSVLRKV